MDNTRRYEGFVKDQHGNRFRVTCEAKDYYDAKRILESQHAPNPVNFIREIK